jgi:hypothetical protein
VLTPGDTSEFPSRCDEKPVQGSKLYRVLGTAPNKGLCPSETDAVYGKKDAAGELSGSVECLQSVA